MRRLRPRTTVLGGLAIGLIAGAAAYGATSPPAVTTAPTAFAQPAVPPADSPARPRPARKAPCAVGQKLQQGVCIIHVVRTVVIPAPAGASNPGRAQAPSSAVYRASATSGTRASSTRIVYQTRAASPTHATYRPRAVASTRPTPRTHTTEPGEHQDSAEHSRDSAEHSTGTSGHDD